MHGVLLSRRGKSRSVDLGPHAVNFWNFSRANEIIVAWAVFGFGYRKALVGGTGQG